MTCAIIWPASVCVAVTGRGRGCAGEPDQVGAPGHDPLPGCESALDLNIVAVSVSEPQDAAFEGLAAGHHVDDVLAGLVDDGGHRNVQAFGAVARPHPDLGEHTDQ